MIDKFVDVGTHQLRVVLADGASEPTLDYGKCRTKNSNVARMSSIRRCDYERIS